MTTLRALRIHQEGGLSETHDGGYAEFARVPREHVIPLPAGLDEFQAKQESAAYLQHIGATRVPPAAFDAYLQAAVTGRTVVKIG
jgi:NADPH:quinone reductase-like Zn-dependent oxidoreductase